MSWRKSSEGAAERFKIDTFPCRMTPCLVCLEILAQDTHGNEYRNWDDLYSWPPELLRRHVGGPFDDQWTQWIWVGHFREKQCEEVSIHVKLGEKECLRLGTQGVLMSYDPFRGDGESDIPNGNLYDWCQVLLDYILVVSNHQTLILSASLSIFHRRGNHRSLQVIGGPAYQVLSQSIYLSRNWLCTLDRQRGQNTLWIVIFGGKRPTKCFWVTLDSTSGCKIEWMFRW